MTKVKFANGQNDETNYIEKYKINSLCDLIKWIVVHVSFFLLHFLKYFQKFKNVIIFKKNLRSPSLSCILEIHVLFNELTKEKVYRLRIEKFTDIANNFVEDKKIAILNPSQSLLEKYVFNGVDSSKVRFYYDESSANVLSVFKQLLTPFLNENHHYACNHTVSTRQLLSCGSEELKRFVFQRCMLENSSGLMEANLAEFLNYIWRETMGDLQDLFGKQFQLSNFTFEQVIINIKLCIEMGELKFEMNHIKIVSNKFPFDPKTIQKFPQKLQIFSQKNKIVLFEVDFENLGMISKAFNVFFEAILKLPI